ncbi:hypothetical protein [Hahella sp. HN01]|uniref:hypothetical protein n=1 Tax=Hahella sp. HN01 TaxID=2847262 RepID=UPI001C1EA41A|nr:hypothetical protein [Hahella sp. HN01]MBU6952825.1 hypothetical protein [Hahella sp. HN01]
MNGDNWEGSFYSRMFGWLFLSPFVFGYFLLKCGVDVSSYSAFKVINSFFYGLMPILESFESNKSFDGSVSGFFSFLYVWMPMTMLFIFMGNLSRKEKIINLAGSREGRKLIFLTLIMTILLMLATQFSGVDPGSCRKYCANASVFGFLAILGGLWVTLTLFLSFFVVLIYAVLRKG